MHWRTALTELLEAGSCRTQGELVREVQKMTGERVNQATVSRELHALGAVKVDGAYRAAPPVSLGAPVHKFSVTSNGCMAVVRTDSACGRKRPSRRVCGPPIPASRPARTG